MAKIDKNRQGNPFAFEKFGPPFYNIVGEKVQKRPFFRKSSTIVGKRKKTPIFTFFTTFERFPKMRFSIEEMKKVQILKQKLSFSIGFP